MGHGHIGLEKHRIIRHCFVMCSYMSRGWLTYWKDPTRATVLTDSVTFFLSIASNVYLGGRKTLPPLKFALRNRIIRHTFEYNPGNHSCFRFLACIYRTNSPAILKLQIMACFAHLLRINSPQLHLFNFNISHSLA